MKKKRGLVSCVQEFTKDAVLTPIFVVGEVAFDVLIPMMMAQLIDKGIDAGNLSNILRYGGLLVGMALVALVFGTLSGRFAARASTGFSRNLRREMYRNVQNFSFSNIDKFSTGGIITRLTTDVTNVQMAFMMIIRVAVRCPIMLICAWVLTFKINPQLAMIFLVVIPVLAVGIFLIMRGAHPLFERVFKKYDVLNNVVQENLLGIRGGSPWPPSKGAKAAEQRSAAFAFVFFEEVFDGLVQKTGFCYAGLFGEFIERLHQLICQRGYELLAIHQDCFCHRTPPVYYINTISCK